MEFNTSFNYENDISLIKGEVYTTEPIPVFYEGPPFCSGIVNKNDPNPKKIKTNFHSGTVLQSLCKSVYQMFYELNGKQINYTTGSDCHGMPSEQFAMAKLGLKTTNDVFDYGLNNFTKYCKDLIYQYEDSWYEIYKRLGRTINRNDHYRTMDNEYMESIIYAFKTMYDKGYIYEGTKILPYSYSCETALSNFEAKENYKTINTETVYFKCPLKSNPDISFLVWTTTPWTIPSNIALCVCPNAKYVLVTDKDNNKYIIGENMKNNINNIKSCEFYAFGKDMVNTEYISPMDFYNDIKHIVLADDFVSDEDVKSTGIVHISPFFGESDYNVIVQNNIMTPKEILDRLPIDDKGIFNKYENDYIDINNKLVFDTDKIIIKYLKSKNIIYKTKQIAHSYPHCPRSKTPLIYKACTGYFVKVTAIKDKLYEHGNKINWQPEFIKNRFMQWVDNIQDWCISRTRFFGTPIPIWKSEDNDKIIIGSIEELEQLTNIKINNLHYDIITKIIIEKNGKKYYHEPFTFDCWFESGAASFAQYGWPFKNKNLFDKSEYMFEFTVEGYEQYNKFFYTSLVLSIILFDKTFCKNILCTGLILSADGKKMSKSSGNFIDPEDILEQYGSDSYRLYLLNSPATEGENFKFIIEDIKNTKQKIIQLLNAVKFFGEYYIKNSNNECIDKNNVTIKYNDFDIWIYSRIKEVANLIKENLSNFKIKNNCKLIYDFIEDLTNYYIKLNRNRIKGIYGYNEQYTSIYVLKNVLDIFVKIIYPFMPFTAGHIFKYLKTLNIVKEENIYNCLYPDVNLCYDDNMIKNMKIFQDVLITARATRLKSKNTESVKKPVRNIDIVHTDINVIEFLKKFENILLTELNTMNINFVHDTTSTIFSIQPDFKELSKNKKQYMKQIKNIIADIEANQQNDIKNSYDTGNVIINNNIGFTTKEFIIKPIMNYKTNENNIFSINGNLVIDIDTVINEDLNNYYMKQQIVREIQHMRKDKGLRVSDKIHIIMSSMELNDIIKNNIEYFNKKLHCETSYKEINEEIIIDKSYDIIKIYNMFNDLIYHVYINITKI